MLIERDRIWYKALQDKYDYLSQRDKNKMLRINSFGVKI